MHQYPLLEILAIGFTLALVMGYLAKRLGLSSIVGYLLAGFLVGPHSPGFAADIGLAMELAEVGVILLMFGVGLHFHLEDLLAVRGISLPGALIQSSAATLCGFAAAEACGLSVAEGLLMGMGLAVASTVVLLRVLTDNHMLDTVHGHVAVGWLVVEDILTVLILVLLPSLAVALNANGGGDGGVLAASAATSGAQWLPMLKAVGLALLRLGLLWVIVLVIGGRVVPWVLNHILRTRSQELFTLTVLVAAFATAVGAAVFFEASVALGAFLGGMVVGKSRVSHQAGADLLPFRDAFAVLFFLSVGMLLDPAFIVAEPGLILAALVIVLVVKPLTAIFVVSALGYSAQTGLVVGISLAQVGEFSFILASQAHALNIIGLQVYNVLVVCAIVSITLNPGTFRALPRIEAFLKKRKKLWALLNVRANRKARKIAVKKLTPALEHQVQDAQAIIVGYGPTGQSVLNALTGRDMPCAVIDMNVDTVNHLNQNGQRAIFGDSSKLDILKAAGLAKARYLVITLPSLEAATITAMIAREENPDLRILVRARFLNNRALLKSSGADAIVFEEEEVALALTNTVLDDVRLCDAGVCPIYDPGEAKNKPS